MSDIEKSLYAVLMDTILPNLLRIQTSQAEQRLLNQRMDQDLEEFRMEMQARFDELRAELAATRTLVQMAMSDLRESEARFAAAISIRKDTIVH